MSEVTNGDDDLLSKISYHVVGGEEDDEGRIDEKLRNEIEELFNNHFFPEDPLFLAFGIQDKGFGKVLRHKVMEEWFFSCLDSQRCSVLAKDEKGRVVGAFVGYHGERPAEEEFPFDFDEDTKRDFPDQVKKFKILDNLWQNVFCFSPGPLMDSLHCDHVFLGEFLCISPDWRRKGLGRELTKRSVEVARGVGCDCYTVWTSVDGSRKIFKGLGFEDLKSFKYDELVDEETGELVVKETLGHVGNYLSYKRL